MYEGLILFVWERAKNLGGGGTKGRKTNPTC